MRHAAVLIAVALLGCGRDLALPPAVVVPQITGLTPATGFAGDSVTLTFDQAAPPVVAVRFGGLDAAVQLATDRLSAVAVVPAGGSAGSVDVTVIASGASSAAKPFALLGEGELRGSGKASTLGFLPDRAFTWPASGGGPFAGAYASLDAVNGRLLVTGDAVNLATATGDGSTFAFRTSGGVAVLSGFRSLTGETTPPAKLRGFVFSAPAGGPPAITEPAAAISVPRFQRYTTTVTPSLDASPSGARLAIPADSPGILVLDTATGASTTVTPKGMGGAAQAARWVGESQLVAWTASRFFLFDPANPTAATSGTALADPNAYVTAPRLAAVDPARTTLAYLRADGRIGQIGLADPQLQPKAVTFATFYAPTVLAWSADSKTITVASGDPYVAQNAVLETFDAGSGALLAAARLPAESLATGEAGADAGLPVIGFEKTVQVLTPALQPARELDHQMVSGLAVASDGALLVGGALGITRIEPVELGQQRLPASFTPDSLKTGQGEALGWTGSAVYLWNASARRFDPLATASGPVADADLSAARDWLSVTTTAGDVQLFHPGTAAAALTLPGLTAPLAAFSGGLLYLGHTVGTDSVLDVYLPGQAQPQTSSKLTSSVGAISWLCAIPTGGVLATGLFATAAGHLGRVLVVQAASAPGVITTVTNVAKAGACSPDGRQLMAFPPGAGVAADSLFGFTLDGPRRQLDRLELDFDAAPLALGYSRDGARLFVDLGDRVAVVE